MKTIVILFAISFIAVLGFTDEDKAKFEKYEEYKEACITETGVDSKTVHEYDEKFEVDENDEKLACYYTCWLKKSGTITEDGDIDWETARANSPSFISQENFDEMRNKCKDTTGTGCQKGLNLMICIKKHMKEIFTDKE